MSYHEQCPLSDKLIQQAEQCGGFAPEDYIEFADMKRWNLPEIAAAKAAGQTEFEAGELLMPIITSEEMY